MIKSPVEIAVSDLTIAYGDFVLLKNVSFEVNKGDVFIIMGASGGGKSSLLRVLTGLVPAARGKIVIGGVNFTAANDLQRQQIMQKCGILYQSGALFSSMTLAENIAMPLKQYTNYSNKMISELVSLKLVRKRAGLARAMALNPTLLFFDEPSAGLDPISSKMLDDLILDINQSLGTTIVVVTHELNSIFAIGNNSIFLDTTTKSISARGNPRELLKNPPNQDVYNFLTRGEKIKNA